MKRVSEIEIRDMNGARIFHGYQVENSVQWHVSGINYSGVIICHGTGDLIKFISREIHNRDMWSVHTHALVPGDIRDKYLAYDCFPDEMGGVVIDNKYLGYAEFMRRIIPKPVDSEPDL